MEMANLNPAGETQQILSAALHSFQSQGAQMARAMHQVGQSLNELARGQNQMLNLMQGPSTVPMTGPMTSGPMIDSTPRTPIPEDFYLDTAWSDPELEGSEPDTMFNPNEMHSDVLEAPGQPGC